MANLRRGGWVAALAEQVLHLRIPILGVCLGMQILARESEEGGTHAGLGWIDAKVRRFDPVDPGVRVPHVGWNNVYPIRESPLFEGVESGRDFYFVHSLHMLCAEPADVLAITPYDGDFVSAVQRENIYGAQFHPEKSQSAGLRLLANFLAV